MLKNMSISFKTFLYSDEFTSQGGNWEDDVPSQNTQIVAGA